MFFWKKQQQIEKAIEAYLDEARNCLSAFGEGMEVYFSQGATDEFGRCLVRVSQHEWQADLKRRAIEQEMYDKALIPALRGDILHLLEQLDLMPNCAEKIMQKVWMYSLTVPPEYHDELRELLRLGLEAFGETCRVVAQLFADAAGVLAAADTVVDKEKQADAIERRLIRRIFDSPRELAEKLLLKEFVADMAGVADLAEDASDCLRVIAAKQHT